MDYRKTTIVIGTTMGGVMKVEVDGTDITDALSEKGMELMTEVNSVANVIVSMKSLIRLGNAFNGL